VGIVLHFCLFGKGIVRLFCRLTASTTRLAVSGLLTMLRA
jgi:hypothetical protein